MKLKTAIGSLVALMAYVGVGSAQPAPSTELSRLEARLVDLRQRFNDRHPEVIALNENIRAQRQAERISQPTTSQNQANSTDLDVAKKHLEELRQRFTDKHPEVIAQTQRVKELEQSSR
jgi:uncharacterized protein involved in exopolysaccharide biosynthesis